MMRKCITYLIMALIILHIPLFAVSTADLGINQKIAVLAIPIDGSSNPTNITQPGAYRLTKNLYKVRIVIQSSDVCLFLNGFNIDTNLNAITIDGGLQDIIIQGGEIIDSLSAETNAGILINDNCSNIVIQSMKISHKGYGIQCAGGTGSTNIAIRNSMISNCDYGIYASDTKALRIKHVVVSAENLFQGSSVTGIAIDSANGTTIDHCTLTHITRGIVLSNSTESTIKNCVLHFLGSRTTLDAGILSTGCMATLIDNCTVNYATSYVTTITVDGISLTNEESSCIRNCLVNAMNPNTDTITTVGIAVRGTSTNCMVQNNITSNLFGDYGTGFGYFLDTTTTPTNMFVGNKAITCNSATVTPYSSNVPYVITAPFYPYTCPPNNDYCPSDFAWNWIIP